MKKVLFVLHYPPPRHGAAMVGGYIKESKHVNSSFDCRYVNLGTSVRVDEIEKVGFQKIKRIFQIGWRILRYLFVFKPDLVYFSLSSSRAGFYKDALYVLLAKLFRRKLVYHFHNKGISKRQDKWFDDFLYKLVFKKADVILLSKYLYYDIEKYVTEDRVHYCPNGIPKLNDLLNKKTAETSVSRKVEILFLSNLIASKGIFVLLEACKVLLDRKVAFYCTFIGGEGDVTATQFQKKVVDLGLEANVVYAGRKYGDEKIEAYSRADIFALPTYYRNECFPLVLLEAMQFALPVVATSEGGIPDIVEEGITGLMVPQNDPGALAATLENLIEKPELRSRLGANGKKRYDSNFRLETFEAHFVSTIKKILR